MTTTDCTAFPSSVPLVEHLNKFFASVGWRVKVTDARYGLNEQGVCEVCFKLEPNISSPTSSTSSPPRD